VLAVSFLFSPKEKFENSPEPQQTFLNPKLNVRALHMQEEKQNANYPD
jgi:hypothetical protein